MGYRNDCEKPKHKPNRTIQKTITPATFYVTNGEESRLAFPCWYNEVTQPRRTKFHCRDHHDHVGWPEPRYPDHSCQDHDFAHIADCDCHHHNLTHTYGFHAERIFSNDPTRHHPHHYNIARRYINLDDMYPIHLLAEGYEKITVNVSDETNGISAKGWIDKKQDWIVRVLFRANIADLEKPLITDIAIRAENKELNKIDTVFLGKLIVLPSAMHELPSL